MPTLNIDGKSVHAPEGATLLEAARLARASIPTLCNHPALEPYGGCRLCVVETTRPAWNGSWKMVVSCMAQTEQDLIVRTSSDAIHAARREIVDLLLARCPGTPLVQDLARGYGLERSSYEIAEKPSDCILCGMCSRACDRLGLSAISMVERGTARAVAPPLRQPPPDCVGCLACAEICPTKCIASTSGDQHRTIWGRHFELLKCSGCGRPTITPEQAALMERRGVPRDAIELCDQCKRSRASSLMADVAVPKALVAD